MCDEPRYQVVGPSVVQAVDEHVSLYSGRATCTEGELRTVVQRCVQEEHDRYGGLGSYRGYTQFVVGPLRTAIEKALGDKLGSDQKENTKSGSGDE